MFRSRHPKSAVSGRCGSFDVQPVWTSCVFVDFQIGLTEARVIGVPDYLYDITFSRLASPSASEHAPA